MEIAAQIKRVRTQLGFDGFELTRDNCSKEELQSLRDLPKVSQRCIVKTHPTKSKSAYAGMKEPAVIAGYMRGNDTSIKALVIYIDQEDEVGNHDFTFVDVKQVKPFVEKEKAYHAYVG